MLIDQGPVAQLTLSATHKALTEKSGMDRASGFGPLIFACAKSADENGEETRRSRVQIPPGSYSKSDSMLLKIYESLLKHFGPQHWWPINDKTNPTYEICVGAILTQNTAWANVEKALNNLIKSNAIDPRKILAMPDEKLKKLIRPAGFFNQKAERLKAFTRFFLANPKPTREQLLALKGIGPETADSILLYAFNKPYFVIDAYTKRVFSRLGLIKETQYEELQKFFEQNLPKKVSLYKEYHALIVELAKKYCGKIPRCDKCPLKNICKYD